MVQLGLRVSHFFSSAMMSFVNCVAFGTEPVSSLTGAAIAWTRQTCTQRGQSYEPRISTEYCENRYAKGIQPSQRSLHKMI